LGKKIIFTNGCFDLLHLGHVQLIQEAAAQGDKLIVALNSDSSVKRLKGPSRPIQPQKARAIVMAALEGVDAVILFDEDTPLKLIEALMPDVLVKGGDYDVQSVVGAQHVMSHGGKVHLANFVQGYSTTKIVAEISA
jgi:D-beta-D-heptose 7-phosphate kinase/D-beta-D-heptose 1-phosphate adenosyltransferase